MLTRISKRGSGLPLAVFPFPFGATLRNRTVLCGVVVVAVAMRFAHLDSTPISRDECSSWRVCRYATLDLIQHCAANVHAPLSFLLLKAWTSLFGDSIFAMRSLSACYGILCVPLMYFVALEAGHLRAPSLKVSGEQPQRWLGLLPTIAVAVHPLQLEAARTARMYSLGVLLTLLTTWLLLRALRHSCGSVTLASCFSECPLDKAHIGPLRSATLQGWILWSGYGLTVAALAYTHNYALLTILAQLAFAVIYLVRVSQRAANSLASLAGVVVATGLFGILYSPWLPVLCTFRKLKN